MLKNFWYVCEESTNVTTKPVKVTALGQRLVLWRDHEGKAHCMSDLCIHRGGALSDGWVDKDSCIRCPYHGWAFRGGDGQCTDIPANQPGRKIPPKARVDAYPVVERYGWVWVFLGDLPESERPPIPEFPEWGDDKWRTVRGSFHWNANYARVVENGMDIAHTPYVHAGSFGNPEEPQIQEYSVTKQEFGGLATVKLRPPAPSGLWKFFRTKERPPIDVSVGFFMPSVTKLLVDLQGFEILIYSSHLPIDDQHTLSRFIMFRNFFKGRWADGDSIRRTVKIFYEDQKTVEAQRPDLVPFDIAAELHVPSDALPLYYRKLRREYLQKGWGIDTTEIERQRARRREVVIPSPHRVGDPKHWVFPEVPTIGVPKEQSDTPKNGHGHAGIEGAQANEAPEVELS